MELREPYTNINRVCETIRMQVIDSIPYAYENAPACRNPEQLFKWLKLTTRYKSDPEGYEFIQSMQTLYSTYKHRSGHVYNPGEGDCDCFVVTTIACMQVQGKKWMKDFGFYLAGRSKKAPVHIFSYINWNGKETILDLTQPYIDKVREYPHFQKIQL